MIIDHDQMASIIRARLAEDALDAALEQRKRHRAARSLAARRGHTTRMHHAIERDPVWLGARG